MDHGARERPSSEQVIEQALAGEAVLRSREEAASEFWDDQPEQQGQADWQDLRAVLRQSGLDELIMALPADERLVLLGSVEGGLSLRALGLLLRMDKREIKALRERAISRLRQALTGSKSPKGAA